MNTSNTLFISALHAPADSPFAARISWDPAGLYSLLAGAFPSTQAAQAARILFRFEIEGDLAVVYIQTRTRPDWSGLEMETEARFTVPRPLELPPLEPGAALRFRLLARPSKRLRSRPGAPPGRRTALVSETEQRQWLLRKAAESGFLVQSLAITDRIWYDPRTGHTLNNREPKPIHAALFDGTLEVTSTEKLCRAVASGIGPQKSMGFGLLSLAPA